MLTMILYKGAGPGTHWHQNDAQRFGFTSAATRAITPNSIVTHITSYSHPSPLISFSTSFAVAREYAISGPGGIASQAAPGYVYEVDLQQLPSSHAILIRDPLGEISSSGMGHGHDGDQQLIEGVATGSPTILTQAVVKPGNQMGIPTVTSRLRALVNAVRDAEVLLEKVPANCVVNRHNVW